MSISRRNFIKSLGAASVWFAHPDIMLLAANAASLESRVAGKSKILIVVQMNGGNDGLNTVVPFGNGMYYQLRPTIAVPPQAVLRLNNQIGLNRNLRGFADLYYSGKLAIIQAVGYPNPNRSHFRSMEIWQTAEPNRIAENGWLGKYLDLLCVGKSKNILPAVNIDPVLPKTLSASKVIVPSTTNVEFLKKIEIDANQTSNYLMKMAHSYKGTVNYPNNSFGNGLKFIAQMICSRINSKIYNISLNGFDTHANQIRVQNNLLKQLSDGLAAFQADLEEHGLGNDVLVFCFTEFGRAVAENGGHGTDHGTAEPVFVIGSGVKGGIYGDHADLNCLDQGDLKYRIDFRSVYASILDRWMGADSQQVLGAHYEQIPFV